MRSLIPSSHSRTTSHARKNPLAFISSRRLVRVERRTAGQLHQEVVATLEEQAVTTAKAALIAFGLVGYWGVLMTLITLSGPSMKPNGVCCDEGISVAYGMIWLGLGLGIGAFIVIKAIGASHDR